MKDKLVEIKELVNLLGCNDERTIEKWCTKRKMPIIKMGKKKYTVSFFLELFITDELEKYVKTHYSNAEKIMEAIKEDDKIKYAQLTDAPLNVNSKNSYTKKAHSTAAQKYLNKIKAA